jgi:hypothetical protein
MQLIVICNYIGHAYNYKIDIIYFLGHMVVLQLTYS